VEVEDAGEFASSFVPARGGRVDGHDGTLCQMVNPGTAYAYYSRGSKEGRDHPKYVGITLGGIAEPRGIDQDDTTAVEIQSPRCLYSVCARSQFSANTEA